jgi:UDP-glucose 4-epimerase
MSGFRGQRVLVTGATGFIGSRVAHLLAAAGAELHITVREGSRRDRLGPLWDEVQRHQLDLVDADRVQRVVADVAPHYVFHLAKERAGATFEGEVAVTLRLAEALHGLKGLRAWVRTALSAREKFGQQGDGYVAAALAKKYGLPIVTLDLYQVYGPGQMRSDFPIKLIAAVLAGGGPTPEMVEGGGVQDFVFVEDVAAAYLAAGLAPQAQGESIPIGTGIGCTRGEVASRVLEKMDALPPGTGLPPRKEGDGGHPAKIEKAERLLGWKASTTLDAGLDQVIKWCRLSAQAS